MCSFKNKGHNLLGTWGPKCRGHIKISPEVVSDLLDLLVVKLGYKKKGRREAGWFQRGTCLSEVGKVTKACISVHPFRVPNISLATRREDVAAAVGNRDL